MKSKTKAFDCVEMKRQGAELVQQRLAGMTREQQLEYWRAQTEFLRQRQDVLLADKTKSVSPSMRK